MNFFQRNRFIFWVLMFLVIINISALASFFLFRKSQAPAACCTPAQQQCAAFRDELKLSDQQTVQVSKINSAYTIVAGPISQAVKETRASILTELEKESPDTLLLNKMALNLSLLQLEIQKENIRQYRALKKVCTPEQAQRLSALYRDLYGCSMQGGQMKYRYRKGQGTGKRGMCE